MSSFSAAFLGIALSYFCFGFEIWHLFAQSSAVYLMLYLLPSKQSHLVVFIFCMTYMSVSKYHFDQYELSKDSSPLRNH